MSNAITFPDLSVDEQYEHIEDLEELLEKQRLMYTRLSLSDDPEAKEMKKDIEDSMGLLGLQQKVDAGELFKMMHDTIVNLRKFVENNELDNL